MKRIVFSKLNELYNLFENVGTKEYEDVIEDDKLHEYGKDVSDLLDGIIKAKVKYHIEKLSEDGSMWNVQAYLPDDYKVNDILGIYKKLY